jgi:hypothetical protein
MSIGWDNLYSQNMNRRITRYIQVGIMFQPYTPITKHSENCPNNKHRCDIQLTMKKDDIGLTLRNMSDRETYENKIHFLF